MQKEGEKVIKWKESELIELDQFKTSFSYYKYIYIVLQFYIQLDIVNAYK